MSKTIKKMRTKKEKFSWGNRGGCITCVGETFETLEAGYYNFYQSPTIGLYFVKARVKQINYFLYLTNRQM